MYYQVVMNFDDDETDPRYGIRPKVSEDVPEDNTVVLIDSTLTEQQGITLDNHGFPTAESLETWHRKHNPQLFIE